MDNNEGMIGCTLGCWLVAALGGALAAVLLWVAGGWTFAQGAFAGAVIFAVAGLLLSWLMCRPLPAVGSATVGQKDAATQKAEAARAVAEERSAEAASEQPSPTAAAAPSAPPAPTVSGSIKPSKPLAGEAELATRKGEWKYQGGTAPTVTPTPAAKKTAPKVAEAPAPTAAAGEGSKPEALSAAREGGPDNLKEIKGVGPKLEALLHTMGFYHFDQIANWSADEVAWVDQNLEGFKGRVTRDNWVEQARLLASGGETEFSKKVDKGDVY